MLKNKIDLLFLIKNTDHRRTPNIAIVSVKYIIAITNVVKHTSVVVPSTLLHFSRKFK